MSLTSFLCGLLGGHSYGLPRIVDGKLCLRCQYDCGKTTVGVVLRESRKVVPFLNLRVVRSASRKVA